MVNAIGSGGLGATDLYAVWQNMLQRQSAGTPDPAAMFKAADKDEDGALSKTEFANLQKDMQAQSPSVARVATMPLADEVFSKADSNGDGSLSMTEFKAMGEAMRARIAGSSGGAGAAGGLGNSGSGLKSVVSALSQGSSSSGSTTTDAADANGDGTVSLQELIAYYREQTAQAGQSAQLQNGSALELVA